MSKMNMPPAGGSESPADKVRTEIVGKIFHPDFTAHDYQRIWQDLFTALFAKRQQIVESQGADAESIRQGILANLENPHLDYMDLNTVLQTLRGIIAEKDAELRKQGKLT